MYAPCGMKVLKKSVHFPFLALVQRMSSAHEWEKKAKQEGRGGAARPAQGKSPFSFIQLHVIIQLRHKRRTGNQLHVVGKSAVWW